MSEKPNAAGLIVSGDKNPNWKGGKIEKVCSVCGRQYPVSYTHLTLPTICSV